jgi:hypothetical protein
MPAVYHLTWDGSNKRWRIMHKGQRYVISCRQLGTPPTKEQSYRAANEWWRQKLTQLDVDSSRKKTLIAQLDSQSEFVERLINHTDRLGAVAEKALTVKTMDEVSVDMLEAMLIPGGHERIETSGDLSVSTQVTRYLALEQARVKSGQLSLVEYDLARRCLDYFSKWVKPATNVQRINPDVWENYWTHLMGLDCSIEYKKKRFRYAKNLITWLASKGIIPMPANLISRKYKFGSSTKQVSVFTLDEVRTLLNAVSGQLELHFLLMMNCGFNQQDVSDLVQSEVDRRFS